MTQTKSILPKLTISIPTWNRAKYLQENILSIISAVAKVPEGWVEIFVSDNASNDETPHFLAEISKQHAFIRYVSQKENMGANANFYTVLKEAKGEYVWLLGDDDQIHPNCIAQILTDMEHYQAGVMIGGTEHDMSGKRVYLTKIKEHLLTDQTILTQYDGFVLAGKMSVLIFSKAALDPILEKGWEIIQKTHTPWPHLIWLFKLLAQQHSLLILPYSTNFIVEKNRFNLLQCGVTRIDLMFVDYTEMLLSVINEFDPLIQKRLLQCVVAGRTVELIKILAYATFLNSYTETLKNAYQALVRMPLMSNRSRFIAFYLLPALLPKFFRKTVLLLLGKLNPSWREYQNFIVYLQQVKHLKKTAGAREVFNKEYLDKHP